MSFIEKILGGGLGIPEKNSTNWEVINNRNIQLSGVLLAALTGRSRVVVGGWNGADLAGVTVLFYDTLTATWVEEPKNNLIGLVIPQNPTLYYALRGQVVIQTQVLGGEDSIAWDETRVPLLVAGHYQNTATTTQPFAEWIGPQDLWPRASQAQAQAGTDNYVMMTALRVLQSIQANPQAPPDGSVTDLKIASLEWAASHSAGHLKFGGIMVQWGTASVGGWTQINWPTTFAYNPCVSAFAVNQETSIYVQGVGVNSFQAKSAGGGSPSIIWIAVGGK